MVDGLLGGRYLHESLVLVKADGSADFDDAVVVEDCSRDLVHEGLSVGPLGMLPELSGEVAEEPVG